MTCVGGLTFDSSGIVKRTKMDSWATITWRFFDPLPSPSTQWRTRSGSWLNEPRDRVSQKVHSLLDEIPVADTWAPFEHQGVVRNQVRLNPKVRFTPGMTRRLPKIPRNPKNQDTMVKSCGPHGVP